MNTRAPYLTRPELVFRSMVAASSVGGMDVRDSERAAARKLDVRVIDEIIKRRPNLSSIGFWAPDCLLTVEQFHADQDKMLDRTFLGQFNRAVAFLLLCCGRRKTINKRISSYGLKHFAERAMRELNVADSYVSNGALICAALALGYKMQRIEGTPNAWLNLVVVEDLR